MQNIQRFCNWQTIVFVGAVTAATLFLFGLVRPQPARAESGERVITIYHDGIEQTVISDGATVAEVLQRAGVSLNDKDAVEPARDTKLVAHTYNVNVYRARLVTVYDGAARHKVLTAQTSPAQVAAAAGLQVHDEDRFESSQITDLIGDGPGLKLIIDRAAPVTLSLYGKKMEVYTQAATVGDLLREKNIKLTAEDGLNIAETTSITPGLVIDVWRNGIQTITEEQPVPFATETIRDADRDVGFREVRTPGKDGKKQVTYEVELRNGQELRRTELQSVVTEQPSKQVEVIGTKRATSGAFADALARLRSCEAGGRYDRNSGNGYYGAYQFNISTWANYAGYNRPDLAPPEIQDQKATETYNRRGWQPWPGCTKKLGLQDIYR